MTKWYKYCILKNSETIETNLSIPKEFYKPDEEAYLSKEKFFRHYYEGYQSGRLEDYDNFIRKYIQTDDKILSIASGRCANELKLIESGYKNITCSDIKTISAIEETKKLFPEFKFDKIDILKEVSSEKHDVAIALSLIYLFDNSELEIVFKNIYESLNSGGRFVLDSAGAPDNILCTLFNDIFLKAETYILLVLKKLKSENFSFKQRHHGYRRSDSEIIKIASKCGFKLVAKKSYAYLTELRRSSIFNRIVKPQSIFEKLFIIIGKKMPYIRMFYFEKQN